MTNCTFHLLHLFVLLPTVLSICLNPGQWFAPVLQHSFFQGFKRRAGQPGMLRQLAGPLRQIKKVSCSHSWFMHKPNTPP